MQPVIILPEKQSEFDALMNEFGRLEETLKRIDDQIPKGGPVPQDALDQIRKCWHRQWAIMDEIRALGRAGA